MTLDDILTLTLKIDELKGKSRVKMSVGEARAAGVDIPENKYGGKSLVRIIKEQQEERRRIDIEQTNIQLSIAKNTPSRIIEERQAELDSEASKLKESWIGDWNDWNG